MAYNEQKENYMSDNYPFNEAEIKTLIKNVQHIKERSAAILEATGGNYNFFRVLGIGHDELIFSRMIANLLKPNASHGFNERFLQLFIENLALDNLPTDFKYKDAVVEIEKDIGARNDKNETGGRIDIFIMIPTESQGSFAFVIENKIYADDQNKQLLRYRNYVNQNYPNRNYILYLTLSGRSPSKESAGEENLKQEDYHFWNQISYKKHISLWIERCAMEAARFPLLRETLITFYNQINKLTGQDGTSMDKKELISLLSKDENIEITKSITSLYSDVVTERARLLISKIKEKATETFVEKDFKIIESKAKIGDKNYTLRFVKNDWTKLILAFGFERQDLSVFKCCILYAKDGVNVKIKDAALTEDEIKKARSKLVTKIGLQEPKETDSSICRKIYNGWIGKEEKIAEIVPNIIKAMNSLSAENLI
jgi:hypothetical protein